MNTRVARLGGFAVGLAAVAAWLLLEGLHWAPRSYATFLLVPLPALLLVQARLVDGLPAEDEREAVYLSSAVSVWTLAVFAMVAARLGGFTRAQLWMTWPGWTTLLAAAAATTAAGVALMAAARLLRIREGDLVRFLLPRTSSEKIAFAGLSVSAGIAEELVFRAFLLAALLEAGAGIGVAVAVSVTLFALSHAYQGIAGAIRVLLLGALLTAPILLTGSVYPSIIAHAALDLIAGLVLAPWLLGAREH